MGTEWHRIYFLLLFPTVFSSFLQLEQIAGSKIWDLRLACIHITQLTFFFFSESIGYSRRKWKVIELFILVFFFGILMKGFSDLFVDSEGFIDFLVATADFRIRPIKRAYIMLVSTVY